jgi:3-deoxy-7-phosphoheptulonate synthase
MLIVMKPDASDAQIQAVMDHIRARGLDPKPVPGAQRTAVCVLGNRGPVEAELFETLPGVSQCIRVTRPYKLVSRETHPENTVIAVNGVAIGGPGMFSLIAGPCAVESRDQIFRVAEALASRGIRLFRAGAFKPRTSPYAFQGLGEEALALLVEVRRQFDLAIVTEAIDHENYDLVESAVDVVQIGARNMQNFSLLRRAGKGTKPVVLKRGLAATIEELLMAAEYIMAGGNRQIVLCERGVRTFADHTRNTLDLSAIPVVKKLSHLPIIADPSHAAGKAEFVTPLALASCGVGADGIMVEVHPEPDKALSDGAQSLRLDQFDRMIEQLNAMRGAAAPDLS